MTLVQPALSPLNLKVERPGWTIIGNMWAFKELLYTPRTIALQVQVVQDFGTNCLAVSIGGFSEFVARFVHASR